MSRFLDALAQRVLIYDGAMGTNIQRYQLTAEDYGGQATEGCNEYLIITRPSVIEEIHTGFLEVGCDVLETDTFTASATSRTRSISAPRSSHAAWPTATVHPINHASWPVPSAPPACCHRRTTRP